MPGRSEGVQQGVPLCKKVEVDTRGLLNPVPYSICVISTNFQNSWPVNSLRPERQKCKPQFGVTAIATLKSLQGNFAIFVATLKFYGETSQSGT